MATVSSMVTTSFASALRRRVPLSPLRSAAQPSRRQHHYSEANSRAADAQATPPSNLAVPVAGTVGKLPFWQRLGPFTRAGEAYARAQRRRPYATQVGSAVVIYLSADLGAQYMSDKEYDARRTARSLTIGAVAALPNYCWFLFLSRHFNYASRLLSIATKVLVNQICFTPAFNTYFFGAQALLSGESLEATWERVKRTVPVSIINSCKVWPAVTAFSFAYIPMEYRSIFSGFVAVGWQTYLSFLNRQVEADEAAAVLVPVAAGHARVRACVDAPRTQLVA